MASAPKSSPTAGRQLSLLFVNTSHPDDATSSKSLSSIRSHVAKDIHARARHARRVKTRPSGDQDASSKTARPRSPQLQAAEANTRTLALSRVVHVTLPSPSTIVSSQGDPFGSSARPLSDLETSLISYYSQFYVAKSEDECPQMITGNSLMTLPSWISFVLEDAGLIAALLYQICRLIRQESTLKNLAELRDQYSLQCIKSTRRSLALDDISDHTIAKVMILASEEWQYGSYETWRMHNTAIYRMVGMRGGLDALGVGGFLKQVILSKPQIYPVV
ncbi:hypothetical protein B0T22DRAFT_296043 [Podospora appendiculata]|uniref:Uncharacterized protein n=1 Tax=Podospora appendiculata TaxID=314037 RepID=A0AAE0X1S7_9PEZI|nr:hypothetical protein B0T22DRAFT_296043 [Podospora appendiculata]